MMPPQGLRVYIRRFCILSAVLSLTIVFLAKLITLPRAQIRHFSVNGGGSTCKPRNHIFYLKTHKTGSSTLAAILFRYGDDRNLTFVLPKGRESFHWPVPFHLSETIPLYAEEGKLIFSHTRYNEAPVHLLFPKPKSKYITVIRHPINHFESVFEFFGMTKKLGLENDAHPIESLFRSKWKEAPEKKIPVLRNPSMFDLGFNQTYFEDRKAVMEYVKYIDSEFDLVMINEYYDESLILLKNLLCWDLEDLLYLKHRVRRKRKELSEKNKENILSWSHADLLLFNHFNATLWRKISKLGPKFYEELLLFRRMNEKFTNVCLNQLEMGEIEAEGDNKVKKYSRACRQMTKSIQENLNDTKKRMEKRWETVDAALPERGYTERLQEGSSGNHDLKFQPVL